MTSRPADLVLSPPDASAVRQATGEQAAAYIRKLIFDGELRHDAHLPQDQIAKALGVSRIPVREAVVALEREGWVTTHLHRGAFVNSFDEATIRDHYELFGLIYGLAIKRTVARQDAGVMSILVSLAERVAATDDAREVQTLAFSFSSEVVEAAQSPRIPVVLRAMSALVPGPFFELVPGAVAIEQMGLQAIVREARGGDGDKAAAEYGKMFRRQAEAVVELFRERNLVSRSQLE